MVGNLRELNNRYNIAKNGFTTLGIIQLMKPIAIVYTPNLFDPLKAISAAFFTRLYDLNIRC